jgi:hypothetical protein
MPKHCVLLALVFCLTLPAFAQQDKTAGAVAQPHHLVVPLASKGLSNVVSGDPTKPGAQYVIRLYNDAGFIVLPHWHPEDEHITVVKGTWDVMASGRSNKSTPMRNNR